MNIEIVPNNEKQHSQEADSHQIETGILMDAYFQLKNTMSELAIKNRALKILSETNQALIYSVDEDALLNKVCHILINHGGYQSVWIGSAIKNDDKDIIPVSYTGFESGYLESLSLTWSDNDRGKGPEAIAVRTGNPIIKHNISLDPDMILWRDEVLKYGYKSIIALPLFIKDKEMGVLNIYSSKIDAFDNGELDVLKELAGDLAYGITSRRITIEHKLLEEELLKASKDRYKALFVASRDAIMTLESPNWNFTSGNPSTLKMFNINNEGDLLRHTPSELSPEFQPDGSNSAEKAKEMIDKAMADGINFFEWKHKRLNGEEFPAEVSLSRVSQEGKVFLHALVRDISERKKLEAQLSEYAEEKFKTIFNSTNDGMLVVDTEGKQFVSENKAICEMLGYNEEELKKLSISDIHPKENLDYTLEQFHKQVRGELKIAKDLPVLRKDKSIFYADVSASNIMLEGKKFVLGVFRDTTERKLAEEILKESEEKYYNLIENIPDAIAVYDDDGKIVFINPESLHLLGATENNQLIGKSVMEFIHPDSLSLVIERMKKSLKESNVLDIAEEKFLRIDGSSVIVEVKSMPIKFENKKAVLVIIRDITERKNLEESKISFLSIASHQLRTPLSMMKWVLDSLLSDENYTPKQLKKINDLVYSNERLINLVEKLLKATMIETGEMVVNKTSVNLEKLVHDLTVSLNEFAKKNSKDIEINTQQNLSLAYCDPILINESIKNLLTNAIIYSDENSHKISITTVERKNDFLISVHNEGFIDSESSEKIRVFNKFSRGSSSSRISPSGSGLGLYITKKMVEVNGGDIGFTSDVESGTTFYFTIIKII